MGRAERNQSIYKENEEYDKQERKQPKRRGLFIAGRILGIIGVLLAMVVVIACLSLVIPKLAGYDAYVVVSGSMEPNIPVGSIVYSKEVDPAELQTGDVIVFIDPARGTTPITHRVVTNNTAAGTIITKGDANEREDVNPVTYDNVIGKVSSHISRIGFTAAMFTSTMGKVLAVLILIEAWLLTEISKRLLLEAGPRRKN